LLKMDLEGHELEAMKGAAKLLRLCEVVVVEVRFYDINNATLPVFDDIHGVLSRSGFSLDDVISLRDRVRDGRLAQGGEGNRINYYYIVNADSFDEDQAAMSRVYPRLVLLKDNKQQRDRVLRQFRIGKDHVVGSDNRLYLVDPAGNLLMHYPQGFKDLGLMEDLKHLLKWSQIG